MVCCQIDGKGNFRLYLVWAIMNYGLTLNLTMRCASNTKLKTAFMTCYMGYLWLHKIPKWFFFINMAYCFLSGKRKSFRMLFANTFFLQISHFESLFPVSEQQTLVWSSLTLVLAVWSRLTVMWASLPMFLFTLAPPLHLWPVGFLGTVVHCFLGSVSGRPEGTRAELLEFSVAPGYAPKAVRLFALRRKRLFKWLPYILIFF